MVSYGEWTQDVDYEQSRRYGPSDSFDNRWLGQYQGQVQESEVRDGSPYVIEPADLADALGTALSIYTADHAFVGSGNTLDFGYDLVFPEWTSNWAARITRAKWRIAPAPGGYFYNALNFGHYDERAIGIQYQGHDFNPATAWFGSPTPSVIQGVYLDADTVTLTTVGDDTRPTRELTESFNTNIMLNPAGGIIAPVGEIPGMATPASGLQGGLPSDVDLTPYLAETDWSGDLWTETPDFVAPFDMSNVSIFGGGVVRYGWLIIAPVVVYVVRPPVWRWVYASTPYRRVFPRDDALAGGAGRNYPPSRAMQSGNRTSGGYL